MKPDSVAGDSPISRTASEVIRNNGQILVSRLIDLLEWFVKDRVINHRQALVNVAHVAQIFAAIHNESPGNEIAANGSKMGKREGHFVRFEMPAPGLNGETCLLELAVAAVGTAACDA
jgi:hypothetical protein